MKMIRLSLSLILSALIVACSTTTAPVIDRTPASKAASPKVSANKPATKTISSKNGSDWRPDSVIVKKGDTLFSIGLEYGYDYKEIARANNIESPYVIKVGQTLKLDTLRDGGDSKTALPQSAQPQSDGVVTYALDGNTNVQATANASTPNPATLKISEPKATREAFSLEAMNKPVNSPKPAAQATAGKANNSIKAATESAETDTKSAAPNTAASTTSEASTFAWSWPTKGKVIANFNDAGNKGIDIAGTKGQPIQAAAAGKIIYSGSDLRGYGKLVIIKHNSTFLSVYANNSNILVKEGQQVTAGQKIAEMGDTDSNTVKLHFEIRQQGKSVDPSKFLATN